MVGPAPQHREQEGSITLVTGRRGYTHQKMHTLLVELALTDPVKVLIGGNRYDHYRINYALAAATPFYEYALEHHIRLSRAETCYQMVELLTQTQADAVPCLVLDLLTTFDDESVPEREIDQLLFESILQLRRLGRRTDVTVSAHAPGKRPQLLKALEQAVNHVEGPPTTVFRSHPQPGLLR